MTKPVHVALFVAIPVIGCGRGPAPSHATAPADSAAVMAAYEQYRRAWLRSDTTAALSLISDDIRIYISGLPDVVGRAATRKLFADEMGTYEAEVLQLNHQDVIMTGGSGDGDHVIVAGRFEEIDMPRKGGPPIRALGRYLTVWRHEPAGWRIIRYMLNDLPPEKPRH